MDRAFHHGDDFNDSKIPSSAPPATAFLKRMPSSSNLTHASETDASSISDVESLLTYRRHDDGFISGGSTLPIPKNIPAGNSSSAPVTDDYRRKLFENLDAHVGGEGAPSLICHAALTILTRGFPGCDDDIPCIPRVVAFRFMREVLDGCGDDISISSGGGSGAGSADLTAVVEGLDFFKFRSVSFRDREVGCIQYSHEIYRDYGRHLLDRLFDQGDLKSYGETKSGVVRQWGEILVDLLETADDWASKIYLEVCLPHHSSQSRCEVMLNSSSFASQRLNMLGVRSAIDVHVFDCEKFPECLPGAYEVMITQLKNLVEWSPDISVQIGQSYLCLAKSLLKMGHPSRSYFEQALSSLGAIMDFQSNPAVSLISPSLLHSTQLDMAETLFHLGQLCEDEVQYVRALQIRRTLLGNCHPLVADTLFAMGELRASQFQYEKALETFEEMLRIQRTLSKEGSGDNKATDLSMAECLEWIGHVEQQMENYNRAKSNYEEAIMIRNLYGEESEVVANLYHHLGGIYEDLKDYDASLTEYGNALSIQRNVCPGTESALETLFSLARIYKHTHKLDLALDCFKEAAEKKAELLTKNVKWIRDWPTRDDARVLPMPLYRDGGRGDKNQVVLSPAIEQDAWGNMTEDEKRQVSDLLKIMMHVVDLSVNKYGDDHLTVADAFHFMGVIYLKIGAYVKAIKSFQEVTRIRTQLGQNNSETMGDAMYYLAMCYARTGDYTNAISHYNKCLNIRNNVKSHQQHIADVWYNMGNAQNANGLHDDAYNSLSTALRFRKSIHAHDHLQVLHVEYCLAVINVHLARFDDAQSALEIILPQFEAEESSSGLAVAHTLYYLGTIYYSGIEARDHSSDHSQTKEVDGATVASITNAVQTVTSAEKMADSAYECFRKAHYIYKKQLDKHHIVMAHVCLCFGVIYGVRGEYYESKKYLENALSVYKLYNGGEHRGVDITLNHLGEVCSCTNDYKQSLIFFQEALQIRKKILGHHHASVAEILHNLGGVHAKLNNFQEAIKCYEEVLAIKHEKFDIQDLSLALTFNNVGIIYARLGEYRLASERLKKALKIRVRYQENSDEVASTLYNLGNVHANTKGYELAAKCYDETLRIRRQMHGDTHPSVAKTLHNLGALFEQDHKFHKAQLYFDEALRVKNLILDPNSLSIAVTLVRIGNVQLSTGDYNKALTCFQQAVKAQKKHHGPDHINVAKTYLKIGTSLKLLGEFDLAIMTFEESLRILEESGDENAEDELANVLYMLGNTYDTQGDHEDAFFHYGNAYQIYKRCEVRCHEYMDDSRKEIMANIRKYLSDAVHVNAGFSDTVVITGDCWLGLERALMHFVGMMTSYVTGNVPYHALAENIVSTVKTKNDNTMLKIEGDANTNVDVDPVGSSETKQWTPSVLYGSDCLLEC